MTHSGSTDPDYELLDGCNHTELHQICQRLGLRVSPALPKQELIALILGGAAGPAPLDVVDELRFAIMDFLLDHWTLVRSQVQCPAKSGKRDACFQCTDAQVIACIVRSPKNEQRIQLKRKPIA